MSSGGCWLHSKLGLVLLASPTLPTKFLFLFKKWHSFLLACGCSRILLTEESFELNNVYQSVHLKMKFWSVEWKNPNSAVAARILTEKCFQQTSRLHINRNRERAGERDCIVEQCLLIATQHTSSQLSQIAIEKWPVMELLASPGPLLPSIIKRCLSCGPLSGLSLCIVSLSRLLATSSPAAMLASKVSNFPLCGTYPMIWSNKGIEMVAVF